MPVLQYKGKNKGYFNFTTQHKLIRMICCRYLDINAHSEL